MMNPYDPFGVWLAITLNNIMMFTDVYNAYRTFNDAFMNIVDTV